MLINQSGILICAYNEEAQIDFLIRKILPHNPSEIVVIDDGSSDNYSSFGATSWCYCS